jgi:hypothetical protein
MLLEGRSCNLAEWPRGQGGAIQATRVAADMDVYGTSSIRKLARTEQVALSISTGVASGTALQARGTACHVAALVAAVCMLAIQESANV